MQNKKQAESSSEIQHSALSIQQLKVASILLAAGESRRMAGRPKQLLEFGGETLLRRAAREVLASRPHPVTVVLGADFERLRAEITGLPVEIVVNENWANGIASSLRTGLKKLLEIAPGISAVCVALADQPLIDASVVNRLFEIFGRGERPIAACEYAETVGVPAIFARQFFDELMTLSGDAGAKKIIERHIEHTSKLFVPEAALDIDTAQDYERLKRTGQAEK